MVRHLGGCDWFYRSGVPRGSGDGCALNVVERHRWSESWQVVRAHLSSGFESRCKPDQGRLAERGSEEAYAQRNAENHTRGNLHDWISRSCRQAGGSKDEVVSVKQVRGPGRVICRRHNRIEVELTDGCVNSVYACIVVNGQRLIVGKPSEYRLGIIGTGCKRVGEVENVLVEERHLHIGVSVIEIDRALQIAAGYGYADSGG